jgi:hypothetical protein
VGRRLNDKILAIEPTFYYAAPYYPCAIELNDGEVVDLVYFVGREHYETYWGIQPAGSSRRFVVADMVRDVLPSGFHIGPRFANQIATFSESGMGYLRFYFHMSDGARLLAQSGNAVDFFEFPSPYSCSDVVGVSEVEGGAEGQVAVRSVSNAWCLIG